ncbi:hypothetical protein N0V88_005147 [Collariella sp. IMI 366227]|nr:hypothetical protein N0V88_005147 [Collariella sp. IMI 366227]
MQSQQTSQNIISAPRWLKTTHPPPVVPPIPAPLARTPNDDFHAEELLKRQRMAANQDKQSQGSLKRAFSSHKKTWEAGEIFEALNIHVANAGAPGVADALIAKLLAVGGNLNVTNLKSKTNLLTRRRSIESMERSRILQKAIENRQTDMVAVLVQHADPFTLDNALPLALRSGDLVMVQLLLNRGANASQTQDAQDAFRQMCIMGGYPDLIALVLQSQGRPLPNWLSMAMVDAARKGCLQTVLRLSRSFADGEHNKGEALKVAITQCRVDIALTVLTGMKPPTMGGQAVLEGFSQLFEHTTIGPNEKMALTEALLCSGASGDAVSVALAHACATEFYDMVSLLVAYGASVEFQGASILRNIISRSQAIPNQSRSGSPGTTYSRHETASVDHKNGLALSIAVRAGNLPMVKQLLAGKPSVQTLDKIFPLVLGLQAATRYHTAECFLASGVSRSCISAALQQAIEEKPPRRDEKLISILLRHNADVNFNDGAGISAAITSRDLPLLETLLKSKPSPRSMAAAMARVMTVEDRPLRYEMVRLLITAGAGWEGTEVSEALARLLPTKPPDLQLAALLLEQGHADANFNQGLPFTIGTQEMLDALLFKEVQTLLKPQPTLPTPNPLRRLHPPRPRRLLNAHSAAALCLSVKAAFPLLVDLLLTGNTHAPPPHLPRCRPPQSLNILDPALRLALTKRLLDAGAPAEEANRALVYAVAAAKVEDLGKRTDVMRLLLEKGVKGEAVDAQLVVAAKHGEGGKNLVRLLLEFGASVDYEGGEALWNATRGAVMGSLKLMLGVERVSERQKKPSEVALLRALRASRKLARDSRYKVIDWLFQAGLPPCEEINVALSRAVKDEPDLRLVQLLLRHGASPLANACETLTDATQTLQVDILKALLETNITKQDASWVFQQAFTAETASTWLSSKGFQTAKMLLQKGADGESLALALSTAIDAYGTENDAVARKFTSILLKSEVDVNFDNGLALQKAAWKADWELIHQVLEHKPNSLAVSMAFPYIFGENLSEGDTLRLIELLVNYHDGEERLDVMFAHPESAPVVFSAVDKFPRSVKILKTLLDAGYYHDQMTTMRVMEDIEEDEQVSLLFWALFQPQKKVSSAIIELLIAYQAKINFETRLSKTTPLMLAIQNRRPDLVKALILAGAEVNVTDATGNTPMTMATQICGDLGTSMMSSILAADPSVNDGSLHNAARDLNVQTMQVLVEYGHDIDFPSTLHEGRTALGELCLNAAHAGPFTATQEKQMEKAMTFLLNQNTDLTIQSDGKSVLLLALHSSDPVPTTRALLKVGLWKHINKPYNHYTDGTYTYSATQYVSRLLPDHDDTVRTPLLTLLAANRAINEIAGIQNQIFMARAELEDARARSRQDQEVEALRQRQAAEETAFAAELRRRKEERKAALTHEESLTETRVKNARLLGDVELGMEGRRQEKMIEWETKMARQKAGNAQALSEVRVKERQAIEKMDSAADARMVARMTEQRRLVERQTTLAATLANAGIDQNQRRQIGFSTLLT